MTDSDLPEHLPERPVGWTESMVLHVNFGRGKKGGGMASYAIKDETGREMPFTRMYDTRGAGKAGFVLPGIEEPMSWVQLRKTWPKWRAEQRTNNSGDENA